LMGIGAGSAAGAKHQLTISTDGGAMHSRFA
jgi:hypothetical protein